MCIWINLRGVLSPPQPLLRQAFGLRSLPECFRLISDSLKGRKVLSTNVMVVIKGHFGGAAAPQEKVLSSSLSPRSACEWHCLCFTYLWQMLAEWNWIPGNEGERSRRASFFFYVWRQDFSWPALIPWLSALRCCWRITTRVEGETGFFLSRRGHRTSVPSMNWTAASLESRRILFHSA